jgi:uncharacterized protein (TIRG00374 family)
VSQAIQLNKSKYLRVVLGIALTVIFLVIAFHGIQFGQLTLAFREINLACLGLSIALFAVNVFCRALMWRVTTRSFGRVDLSTLFGGVVVGYLANNILPLRAGELVRAYYLTARSGIAGTVSFSTVCIERLADIFSLVLLLLAGIAWGIPSISPQNAKKALAVLVLLAVACIIFIGWVTRLRRNGSKLTGLADRLFRLFGSFIEPFKRLRDYRLVALLITLSLAAWFSNYLSMAALVGGELAHFFTPALLLLLFINIGILIPSSPGAFGIMQIAFWMALAPFGVARENALALSFAYQGGLYLFTLAVGIPYFVAAHLKLHDAARYRTQMMPSGGVGPREASNQ